MATQEGFVHYTYNEQRRRVRESDLVESGNRAGFDATTLLILSSISACPDWGVRRAHGVRLTSIPFSEAVDDQGNPFVDDHCAGDEGCC